jgi:hypothetical protein
VPDRHVLCELEPRIGIVSSVFQAAGMPEPQNWRHAPAVPFDLTIDVTPIEHGRFGHRGTLVWRLRVEQWVRVKLWASR